MADEYIIIKDPAYEKAGENTIKGIRAPYNVLAGKLTTKGDIVNSGPDSHQIQDTAKVLTANVADQLVLSYRNKHFKRALLYLKAAASVTSYDWRLEARISGDGLGQVEARIFESTGSTQQWAVNTITNSLATCYIGDVPYGEYVWVDLEMDNNHATTAITMDARLVFFDPVR